MTLFALGRILICVPVTLVCWPAAAQTSGYHTELEEHPAGHPFVVLVNDSEKSIEALTVSQQCKTGGLSAIVDSLHSPKNLTGIESAGSGRPTRANVLEPGARWVTSVEIIQDSNASCGAARVNAVLFTDGTFAGRQGSIRALKGRRDGISASVNFWVERLAQENPDGSNLKGLADEATGRVAKDREMEGVYPFVNFRDDSPTQPLREYWIGRHQVDENIRQQLTHRQSTKPARDRFHVVALDVDDWKKKVDSDLALQKLNSIFPPISDQGVER